MLIARMEAPPESWVLSHCQQAHYSTVSVLDANAFAARLQKEVGIPYVVTRLFAWEPNPPDGASTSELKSFSIQKYQDVLNILADGKNSNVHVMVNCEQGHRQDRFVMYSEMIHQAMSNPKPAGMVFLNASVGTINSGFWGQSNEWEDKTRLEFLKLLDKYRDVRLESGAYAFVLGVHNYSSMYPWIATNGGAFQIPNWQVADGLRLDWSTPQDHLGREIQGIRRALGYGWDRVRQQWAPTTQSLKRDDGSLVRMPWMIVTEELIDALGDVKKIHPGVIASGADSVSGFHTLREQWEKVWFPSESFDATYARMRCWAWEKVYGPQRHVIGTHAFMLGNTGGWANYNLWRTGNRQEFGSLDKYWDRILNYRMNLPDFLFVNKPEVITDEQPTVEVPTVPPDPSNPPTPSLPTISIIVSPDGKTRVRVTLADSGQIAFEFLT